MKKKLAFFFEPAASLLSSCEAMWCGRWQRLLAVGLLVDIASSHGGLNVTGHPAAAAPGRRRRLSNDTGVMVPGVDCISKKLPCAPLGESCKRPPMIFVIKMRGCGGKMMGEGVLNHVFKRSSFLVHEGWSLAHQPVQRSLEATRASNGLVMMMLRDPIERALSRYWFEGRWPLFQKRVDGAEQPFGTWLSRGHCSLGRRGARLWDCTENYYVKVRN